MIPSTKLDYIYNALIVGMTLDDAYIYAGLTPAEIVEAKESEELQKQWSSQVKQFEYTLLSKLNQVIDKQVHMGKEQAITWLLEKTNARYTGKPQNELPELHIHIDDTDPADIDTVTIREPSGHTNSPSATSIQSNDEVSKNAPSGHTNSPSATSIQSNDEVSKNAPSHCSEDKIVELSAKEEDK